MLRVSVRMQQPTSLPNVVQDEIAADEWEFIPLSPDALSGFAKNAQDRSERNQEVSRFSPRRDAEGRARWTFVKNLFKKRVRLNYTIVLYPSFCLSHV